MIPKVLVDAGPLVAIFSNRDQHHQICADALRTIRPPLLTSWSVITEAAWLLRRYPAGVQKLMLAIEQNLISLLAMDRSAVPGMGAFLARYQKIGAQLADASLVYLAERENIRQVFTLDRRDFAVYRTPSNRKLELVP